MKKYIFFFLLAICGSILAEEDPKKPVITPPKGWNTNVAQVQASLKNKPGAALAILFAGADQPNLQKEILASKSFLQYAQKKLVLAYVPLPKAAAPAQSAQDGENAPAAKPDPAALIRAKFKVRGPNCTLLLVNAQGKELGRLTRIEPAAQYLTRIKKFLAPVPEIIQIARSNNLKKMTQYLETNPEAINTSDAFGTTAVAEAVKRNNIKMLELLFSKKANPNRKGDGGMSPLMFWSQRNQKKTAIGDLLLQNGAAINARDDGAGRTVLMIAIQANAMDTVTYLLEKGADINARDKKGETPIMYAIRRKSPDMVELLLSKGARITMQDALGNTPLHIAVLTPGMMPEIVKMLLAKGARKTSKNNKRQTPFMLAKDAKIKNLVK